MQETWKQIPGLEGLYEASSFGRIRSLDRLSISKTGTVRYFSGKIISEQWTNRRYADLSIANNGSVKIMKVHRLVAMAFIPNENGFSEVNHIDGNRRNNSPDNLEWVTRKQNNDHAISSGLKPPVKGSHHGNSKLNESQVAEIKQLLSSGSSGREIARAFHISPTTVCRINRSNSWRHV